MYSVHFRVYIVQYTLGGPTPFLPIPNPDFDVSWEKMGKNVQK